MQEKEYVNVSRDELSIMSKKAYDGEFSPFYIKVDEDVFYVTNPFFLKDINDMLENRP